MLALDVVHHGDAGMVAAIMLYEYAGCATIVACSRCVGDGVATVRVCLLATDRWCVWVPVWCSTDRLRVGHAVASSFSNKSCRINGVCCVALAGVSLGSDDAAVASCTSSPLVGSVGVVGYWATRPRIVHMRFVPLVTSSGRCLACGCICSDRALTIPSAAVE